MTKQNIETTPKVHLQIGELAKRGGVSIRTVRYYEEIGLMKPSGLTSGGIRLYNQQELNRLIFIRRLKMLGLDMKEIKISLGISQPDSDQKVRAEHTLLLLNMQKQKLQEEITKLGDTVNEIENAERLVTRCLSCQASSCPIHCPSLAQIL